jgi:hypothetical protein
MVRCDLKVGVESGGLPVKVFVCMPAGPATPWDLVVH